MRERKAMSGCLVVAHLEDDTAIGDKIGKVTIELK
jgi:hypothetical protein